MHWAGHQSSRHKKQGTVQMLGSHLVRRFALGTSFLLVAGCTTTATKNKQLEAVAKDWSMTIRASQVVPVYPLTEDLQPGDVFLVQLPVDRQQEAYKQKGFLPLDNLIARLRPAGYLGF